MEKRSPVIGICWKQEPGEGLSDAVFPSSPPSAPRKSLLPHSHSLRGENLSSPDAQDLGHLSLGQEAQKQDPSLPPIHIC